MRVASLLLLFLLGGPTGLSASEFTDAAIAQAVKLKDGYRDQYGSHYVGRQSTANLSKTDCYIYSRGVLMHAFNAAGQTEHARAIGAFGEDGGDLAKYLVEKAGWTAYYINPDVRVPADGDDEHPYSARKAKELRKYFYVHEKLSPSRFVPIGGYIVNYTPTPKSVYEETLAQNLPNFVETRRNTMGVEYLARVPFCYGIVRGAMHTFLLLSGKVYEVHYDVYGPTSAAADDPAADESNKLYEVSDFVDDFTHHARNGWLSGAVVCPPDAPKPPAQLSDYDPGK